jgi:hypothetical protein
LSQRKDQIRSRNFRAAVFALVYLVVFCQTSIHGSLFAQDSTRVIKRARTNINDPVSYVGFYVDDKEVQHGVSFQAAGDWLEHLVVVVENRSPKDLIALQMMITLSDFGEGDSKHPPVMAPIIVGQIPEHQLYTKSGAKIPMPQHLPVILKPGQTLRIPIADAMNELKKQSLPSSNLRISSNVHFGFVTSILQTTRDGLWGHMAVLTRKSKVDIFP